MVRRFIKFFEKQPKKVFLGQQHVWEEAVHGVLTLDRYTNLHRAVLIPVDRWPPPNVSFTHCESAFWTRQQKMCREILPTIML
jgi:hypothetical protein